MFPSRILRHIIIINGRRLLQDMCEGEYTPFTNYVRSRVSCIAYTLPALKCILDGVQKIPSAPEAVAVEPLNESSLQVNWSPPARLAERVTTYSINVTMLHSFDEDDVANITSDVSVTVSADSDSAVSCPLNFSLDRIADLRSFCR